MRLIDADALLRGIDDLLKGHYAESTYKVLRRFFFKVVRRIKAAPTVTSMDDLISRKALLKSIKNSTAVREVKFLAQVFAETAPSVNLEQPWIPVTERLPEESDADSKGRVFARLRGEETKIWHWSLVVDYSDNFTHWMPLPEPPKAE